MGKFPFLRRPGKLILYALLMTLVTTAALLFAWQYVLDGIALDHAIDTYAYAGTLLDEEGYLAEIPGELTDALRNSEHVMRIDSRRTQAALAGNGIRRSDGFTAQVTPVPDAMMTQAQVNQHHFIQGSVTRAWPGEGEGVCCDSYTVSPEKLWGAGGVLPMEMSITLIRSDDEPSYQVGQRVFLVGDYVLSHGGEDSGGLVHAASATVTTAGAKRAQQGEDADVSILNEYAATAVPEGVNTEQWINGYLDRTGLRELYEVYCAMSAAMTVRRVTDMKAIPYFSSGKSFVFDGRMLTAEDAGKKVCVIEQGLSQRNRLNPGDTIELAIADGCYTIADGSYADGWESGNPMESDELLDYGEFETYEIVGVYTQRIRKLDNPQCFSRGDIFIPADAGDVAEVERPYSFAFRVAGPDYEDFRAEFEPLLTKYGYELRVVDTGWDDVEENFYAMGSRRILMLWSAIAAFAAAVVLLAVLLYSHCRYELGLRRLMGATRAEAVEICASTFLFTGIPAGTLSVAAAWVVYTRWMKQTMAGAVAAPLPADGTCAAVLGLWTLVALAAALLMLLILGWRSDRRSLLKLLRR